MAIRCVPISRPVYRNVLGRCALMAIVVFTVCTDRFRFTEVHGGDIAQPEPAAATTAGDRTVSPPLTDRTIGNRRDASAKDGGTASNSAVIRTIAGDHGSIIGVICEIPAGISFESVKEPDAVSAILSRVLTVSLVSPATTSSLSSEIPLRGTWSIADGKIRFVPRFRFRDGSTYLARLNLNELSRSPAAAESDSVFEFTPGAGTPDPPAVVTAVYPSTDVVPENLLRFYVHFSRPMARGDVYSHISLLTADGNTVELPFLELGEEFWDPNQQRLTLLLDPGRIKQEVKPREDVGPALIVNTQMTLVIRDTIRDSENRPIQTGYAHRFRVAPPVRTAINLKDWKVSAIAAGTNTPLSIDFPAPLDHALLEHAILVVSADGSQISGRVTTGNHDRRWEFIPDAAWRAGDHLLKIETILEDLAGNRIGRPFEADELGPVTREITSEFATLPFSVAVDR